MSPQKCQALWIAKVAWHLKDRALVAAALVWSQRAHELPVWKLSGRAAVRAAEIEAFREGARGDRSACSRERQRRRARHKTPRGTAFALRGVGGPCMRAARRS